VELKALRPFLLQALKEPHLLALVNGEYKLLFIALMRTTQDLFPIRNSSTGGTPQMLLEKKRSLLEAELEASWEEQVLQERRNLIGLLQ
jgi:hypothetical protein